MVDVGYRAWRRRDAGEDAAREVAGELGLEEPVLISLGGAALWRAGDVALRVERPASDARQLVRLVKLAAAAGVPVAVPLRSEPFEHPQGQVTAWPWIEPAPERPDDLRCLGAALRVLHENVGVGEWRQAGALSVFAMFERRLARNLEELADSHFGSALIDLLEQQRAIWLSQASATLPTPLGEVALHGDVHPGNLITTADGCLLMDWELAGVGPGEWDHAHLLMHARRRLAPPQHYSDFAAGYGADLRGWDGVEAWVRLHELLATARMAARSLRDPPLVQKAKARIAWWD